MSRSWIASSSNSVALRSLLFEVSHSNPLVFTAASIVLLAMTMLASYIPVRRAARTDPVSALKAE